MDDAWWELVDLYELLREGDADASDLEDVDWAAIQQKIREVVTEVLHPHLVDIRQRAQQQQAEGVTRQHARQQLEALPKAEQTDQFYTALTNLVETAALLHTDPRQALSRLKQYARNPWFTERLLLLLSDPEHVDPEHADEMKELAVDGMRWVCLTLVPEIYTDAEKRDLLARLFPDEDIDELWRQAQQQQPQGRPQPSQGGGPGGTAQWHGHLDGPQ